MKSFPTQSTKKLFLCIFVPPQKSHAVEWFKTVDQLTGISLPKVGGLTILRIS